MRSEHVSVTGKVKFFNETKGYPNMQVRLSAAKATLAVAPQAARQAIEAIAASTWPPQCYDARMCLWMIDEGKYVPE
jgi:hypothetical protein